MSVRRGSLATNAPVTGERSETLIERGRLTIETIASGQVELPAEYLQDRDEWVAVLEGSAVLDVAGERVDLGAGDWVLLPGGQPHRLVEVEDGTRWLAVHLP